MLSRMSAGEATGGVSRECLALIVVRQLRHEDVLAALADLFIARGPPANIRSDNGNGVEDVAQQQFIATAVQKWLAQIGVTTLYIAPGSPWDVRGPQTIWEIVCPRAGYSKSFNGSLRDKLLNGEPKTSAAKSSTALPRRAS